MKTKKYRNKNNLGTRKGGRKFKTRKTRILKGGMSPQKIYLTFFKKIHDSIMEDAVESGTLCQPNNLYKFLFKIKGAATKILEQTPYKKLGQNYKFNEQAITSEFASKICSNTLTESDIIEDINELQQKIFIPKIEGNSQINDELLEDLVDADLVNSTPIRTKLVDDSPSSFSHYANNWNKYSGNIWGADSVGANIPPFVPADIPEVTNINESFPNMNTLDPENAQQIILSAIYRRQKQQEKEKEDEKEDEDEEDGSTVNRNPQSRNKNNKRLKPKNSYLLPAAVLAASAAAVVGSNGQTHGDNLLNEAIAQNQVLTELDKRIDQAKSNLYFADRLVRLKKYEKKWFDETDPEKKAQIKDNLINGKDENGNRATPAKISVDFMERELENGNGIRANKYLNRDIQEAEQQLKDRQKVLAKLESQKDLLSIWTPARLQEQKAKLDEFQQLPPGVRGNAYLDAVKRNANFLPKGSSSLLLGEAAQGNAEQLRDLSSQIAAKNVEIKEQENNIKNINELNEVFKYYNKWLATDDPVEKDQLKQNLLKGIDENGKKMRKLLPDAFEDSNRAKLRKIIKQNQKELTDAPQNLQILNSEKDALEERKNLLEKDALRLKGPNTDAKGLPFDEVVRLQKIGEKQARIDRNAKLPMVQQPQNNSFNNYVHLNVGYKSASASPPYRDWRVTPNLLLNPNDYIRDSSSADAPSSAPTPIPYYVSPAGPSPFQPSPSFQPSLLPSPDFAPMQSSYLLPLVGFAGALGCAAYILIKRRKAAADAKAAEAERRYAEIEAEVSKINKGNTQSRIQKTGEVLVANARKAQAALQAKEAADLEAKEAAALAAQKEKIRTFGNILHGRIRKKILTKSIRAIGDAAQSARHIRYDKEYSNFENRLVQSNDHDEICRLVNNAYYYLMSTVFQQKGKINNKIRYKIYRIKSFYELLINTCRESLNPNFKDAADKFLIFITKREDGVQNWQNFVSSFNIIKMDRLHEAQVKNEQEQIEQVSLGQGGPGGGESGGGETGSM